MDETGYIQYKIDWTESQAPNIADVERLIRWRQTLFEANLVGVDQNGVGFGNISERTDRGFLISGTQTGLLPELEPTHFSHVTEYDISENRIRCYGLCKASSEALSHAILYEADPEIGAVIHVHSASNWQRLLNDLPTTDPAAEAGTVEMATEIGRLFDDSELPVGRVLVMGGHRDGLMSFGRNLDEAGSAILRACDSS
jgi:L-ribulose-5-phosphate 4-epimerase